MLTGLAEYFGGSDPARVQIDASAVLEGSYGPADALATPPGTVTISEWKPDAITLDVDAAGPSILVLHETSYPGWDAEVNGASKPVLLANQLFRGSRSQPGARQCAFASDRSRFPICGRRGKALLIRPPTN